MDPVSFEPLHWKAFLKRVAKYCLDRKFTFYAIFDQHNALDLDLRRRAPTNLTIWPSLLTGAKIIISASANNEDTPIKMED
jgi:hypothetical protein